MKTWTACLKWAIPALLIALSAAVAALWALSYCHPDVLVVSSGDYVCNLSNSSGQLLVTIFSAIPEDETYWSLTVPYWMMESILFPATVFMGWRMLKDRRLRHARGFPV